MVSKLALLFGAILSVGATCASPGGELGRSEYVFDGSVAVWLDLFLPEPGVITLTYTMTVQGSNIELATMDASVDRDARDAGYGLGSGSNSVFGEIDLVSPAHAEVNLDLPGQYDWSFGWPSYGPVQGNWSFIVFAGASRPITRTTVTFEIASSASPESHLNSTDRVGLITTRNMDDTGVNARANVLGYGASVSKDLSKTVHLTEGFWGGSVYVPAAGYDQHSFTMDTLAGPIAADELFFLGEPAGDYRFSLNQISAGQYPGRAGILYADFPPLPSGPLR
ncbi:MAG TPA: hypothetical protein VGR28_01690 [Candidatus Thermoplasmatota archaeon]|jgi:hypothetical protein|nr:hypothetical protein [Candidatus Thermoplasmatota archaeon]